MKNILCAKTFVKTLFLNMIVFLFLAFEVNAQQDDHNCTCATCGKKCSEIRISGHVPGRNCGITGTSSSGSNFNPVDLSFTNPIRSGFQGATLLGLGGFLVKGETGEELWLEGAAIGFGVGSSIALFNSLNKRSLVENIALAVIAGGVSGAGVAMSEKALSKPTVPVKPDNTVKYAVIGAVAEVALVTAAISLKKDDKYRDISYRMNSNKFLSKMNINFYGNRVGLLVNL